MWKHIGLVCTILFVYVVVEKGESCSWTKVTIDNGFLLNSIYVYCVSNKHDKIEEKSLQSEKTVEFKHCIEGFYNTLKYHCTVTWVKENTRVEFMAFKNV